MKRAKQSCSGFESPDANLDPELREILNALFCSCLEELPAKNTGLGRDLFRLIEIDGQTLDAAANRLGIGLQAAEQMLAKTRREVAVLLVLGLGTPSGAGSGAGSSAGSADDARLYDCNCPSD
jgi:DNA-directed RNA polymerase specialized sigma24 family protein